MQIKTVAGASVTITDFSDFTISPIPPIDPSPNQLWLDESLTPNMLKKWSGSAWRDIGELDPNISDVIGEIETTLGNMANDNIIDVKERQYIKDKLVEIIGVVIADTAISLPDFTVLDSSNKGSFAMVRKSAINAGIPASNALYTAVASKYNDLKVYLDKLTPIRPWDCSSANAGRFISVVKDTFRDKWLAYYTAVNNLANATSNKLKENVEEVTVGGRNFISNGDFSIPLANARWISYYQGNIKEIVDISTENPPFKYAYHVKNTSAVNGGIIPVALWSGNTAGALVDKEITLSYWLKYQNITKGASDANAGRFGEIIVTGQKADGTSVTQYHATTNPIYITGTNMNWQYVTKTIKLTLPTGATKITNIQFRSALAGCIGETWITGISLVGGNKDIGWIANPDDVEERLSNVEFKVTPEGIFQSVSKSEAFNATLDISQGDYGFENGVGLWSESHDLRTPVSDVTVVEGAGSAGGKVIQIFGQKTLYYGRKIPIQIDSIYRVKFRVRQTIDPTLSGSSYISAGVASYNASKTPITTSAFGEHRYCAVVNTQITVGDGWQTFEGIITGEGSDDYGKFIAGTKYVTPVFRVNHSGGNGTVQVDLCSIEDISDTETLAVRMSSVEQSITATGITTVIQESSFYSEYENALNEKANASDVSENYATKEGLDEAVGNIDIAGKVNELIEDEDSNISRKFSTKYELEQTSTSLVAKFSATGGMNMLKNSIGLADFDFWTLAPLSNNGAFETITDTSLDALGFSSGIKLNAYTAEKSVNQVVSVLPSRTYTLSWYINKTNESTNSNGNIRIEVLEAESNAIINSETYNFDYVTNGYESKFMTFTPASNEVRVRIYGYKDSVAVVTGLMMTIGDVALQWSQATGESYNTNTRMDINGIRVVQFEVDPFTGTKVEKGYTKISPDEFAGYYDVTGDGIPDKVFWLNGDELVSRRLRAEQEITMGAIKVVSTSTGWAIITNL